MKVGFLALMPAWIRIAIIIVMALFLLFVVSRIVGWFKRPPNANYIEGGGEIPDNWTATATTDRLYNAFSGLGLWGKGEAVRDFNEVNDNQKIAIYNDWNERYSDSRSWGGLGPQYGTITEMLKGEQFPSGSAALSQAKIMLSNLKRLQLP